MKKKILFRADGNANTGLGHLYRLFALVEMIKETYEFSFITKKSTTTSVIPQSYKIVLIPSEIPTTEEPEWLAENFTADSHVIFADGYDFDSNYQKRVKELGYRLAYIDDLAIEHMYADIVINHSPALKPTDFSYEPHTQFCLGTSYAILRPAFLEATKKDRKIEQLDRAFVCFGGADKYNLSKSATMALLKVPEIKGIHVVLGAANHTRELIDLAKEEPRLKIYENLGEKDMVGLMQCCNFAIVPSSTVLYELCAINMIILSGYFVDNQKFIYKGFLEENAIFGMDDFTASNVAKFHKKIVDVLNFPNTYNAMLRRQKQLFDSNIRERYLKIISDLC